MTFGTLARRWASHPAATILAAVFICVTAPAASQNSGSTPLVALSRPASVRSAGMNGAGAALVGNAGAIFSNPAGLATIRNVGIEGSFRRVPSEANIAAGALAWRLRQLDLGVGVIRFRDRSTTASTPIPGVSSNADIRELAGIGSLVYRFGIIALAGSGKYARRFTDGTVENTFSADAGLAVAVFDIMAIGFSMQNLGGRWGGDSTIAMPKLTRLAMMWNYVDPLETFRLLSTVELQWPENGDFRAVLGGEGGVVVHDVGIFARAAYATSPAASMLSHMTYGGSLTLSNVAFDYAYQAVDLSGEPAHRFGLRLTL